nr:hypothetical protein GCM10025699_73610 [Microbacterium flavescens]
MLAQEQPGDEEPRDDEEDVDPDEAAAGPPRDVLDDHGHDGHGAQTLDVEALSGRCGLRPAGARGRGAPGARLCCDMDPPDDDSKGMLHAFIPHACVIHDHGAVIHRRG